MGIISVYNISKVHKSGNKEHYLIRDINFSIHVGEFVSITGAAGSGKSTLLDILSMMSRPTTGRHVFENTDLTIMNDDDFARMRNSKIAMVYQSANLISELNVFQNMEIPLIYKGVQLAERKRMINQVLAEFGLCDKINQYPAELSKVEQQIIAIARALLNKPKILMLDEPTGDLNSTAAEEVMDILQQINKRTNLTVIVASNDIDIARHAKRVIAVDDGHIVKDVILSNPIIAQNILKKMRQKI